VNHHQRQYGQLDTETHDASPRDRKEERADGNHRKKADDGPALPPHSAQDEGNKSERENQLDESGEVIAVREGPKWIPP